MLHQIVGWPLQPLSVKRNDLGDCFRELVFTGRFRRRRQLLEYNGQLCEFYALGLQFDRLDAGP